MGKSWEEMIEIFTGLLVLVGFLQWLLIRRQDKHFRISERAWILADLSWYPGQLHVVEGTSQTGDVREEHTVVSVKLTCKNEGRSPAWIDEIRACVEIVTRGSALRIPERNRLSTFGPIEPLGADKEQSRLLQMQCRGHGKESEFLSVYVIVEYRDIFGIKRETFLGYGVEGANLCRQLALPERNRNT
jgi:hypothetical protein